MAGDQLAAGREPFLALLGAPRGAPVALLHSGGRGRTLLCTDPVDTLARPAGATAGAFAELDAFLARHQQRRVVGWLGYDLGLDVEAWPLRLEDDFPVPVLHVAAYVTVQEFAPSVPHGAPALAPAAALRATVGRTGHESRVVGGGRH